MRNWEELKLGFARIQAAQDCRNLMAKYLYYHSAGRHAEYVDLWANRDDCALRMPWGQYNGIEGVRQCYLKEHGTVDEAAGDPGLPFAAIHDMDTEIIEVAQDGQTAKGVWISPGHETFPSREHPGEMEPQWCWGRYGVDFILEDGVWKFWHLELAPMFKCPYDKAWTDMEPTGIQGNPNSKAEPITGVYEWSPTAMAPAGHPEPPLPYKTFADVGSCIKED